MSSLSSSVTSFWKFKSAIDAIANLFFAIKEKITLENFPVNSLFVWQMAEVTFRLPYGIRRFRQGTGLTAVRLLFRHFSVFFSNKKKKKKKPKISKFLNSFRSSRRRPQKIKKTKKQKKWKKRDKTTIITIY